MKKNYYGIKLVWYKKWIKIISEWIKKYRIKNIIYGFLTRDKFITKYAKKITKYSFCFVFL